MPQPGPDPSAVRAGDGQGRRPNPAPLPLHSDAAESGSAIPGVEIAAGAWQLIPPAPADASDVAELATMMGAFVDLDSPSTTSWCVRAAVGGAIVGLVVVKPTPFGCQISVTIEPAARGAGAARTAVGAVARYLRQGVGVARVECAHSSTPAAIAVAKAAGLTAPSP